MHAMITEMSLTDTAIVQQENFRRLLMATIASSSLAQVALVVVNQLRTKLDLDHARQVITISRGLRRLGRLVVDRVKYTYLGMQPSFSRLLPAHPLGSAKR